MKYILYILATFLQAVPQEYYSDNCLPELDWCEERKLFWTDFRARPDAHSLYSAVSATYIEEKHGCSEAGVFEYDVKAVFVKNESWSVDMDSEALLKHEQTHFDLTEYFARKLRLRFRALNNPCAMSEEAILSMVDSIYVELEMTHHLYDQYTVHGLNKENQRLWDDIVMLSLQELNDYTCQKE
ncbi:MAG: hypothetical protein IPL33_11280 [Sphingobacteriales bacterium]|nr:hypothetical protein [Sphingobacteriales bacterium]MCC7223833.1 hypothetical protein [Chitinophagales bacterium]